MVMLLFYILKQSCYKLFKTLLIISLAFASMPPPSSSRFLLPAMPAIYGVYGVHPAHTQLINTPNIPIYGTRYKNHDGYIDALLKDLEVDEIRED